MFVDKYKINYIFDNENDINEILIKVLDKKIREKLFSNNRKCDRFC